MQKRQAARAAFGNAEALELMANESLLLCHDQHGQQRDCPAPALPRHRKNRTEKIAGCTPISPQSLSASFPGLKSAAFDGEPLVRWWLKQPKRRELERIGFYPSEDLARQNPRSLNTYGGLPFDDLLASTVPDMTLVQPVLDHMRNVLANGSEEHYTYQLQWYAACLQTREKQHIVLIYHGNQGCGKDIIIGDGGLFRFIYGPYFQKVSNFDALFEKFNADALAKMFVVLDEVGPYSKSHKRNDLFKDIMASKTLRVEPKHVNPFSVDDCRNFVATTNHADSFKFEPNERRQYMITVNDEWKARGGEHTEEERLRYFSRILGARYGSGDSARKATREEARNVAKHLFLYLMYHVNVGAFNPDNFPDSETRKEQMEGQELPLDAFFAAWRDTATEEAEFDFVGRWPQWRHGKTFTADEIRQNFRGFCRHELLECAYNTKQLSHALKRYTEYIVAVPGRSNSGKKYALVGGPYLEVEEP